VKRWVLAFRAVSASVSSQPPLAFPILRRLVLLAEWPWVFFLASQTLDASSLIYSLLFLPLGSEIFLVSETAQRASRRSRIELLGFLVLH
jgi:hypothetical protein